MLDLFLEATYTKTKQAEAQRSMLSALEALPIDELMAITRGESPLCKVAFHGDDPMCWLERFQGTPLYGEALAIEKRQLELDMQDNAERQKSQGLWNERDVLRVKRRMLELQLSEQQAAGTGDELQNVAPDGAAAGVAQTAAPAPTGEGAMNAAKTAADLATKVAAMRFQLALTKQAFNPLQAAKNVGQLGLHMAKANPTAAMGLAGAGLGAAGGAIAGGEGHRLSGALKGGLMGGAAGAAGGYAAPRMQAAMAKGQSFGQAAKSTMSQAANALGPRTQLTHADMIAPPLPTAARTTPTFRSPQSIIKDLPARAAPSLPAAPARPAGFNQLGA